jgi:hypothetical protein
MNFTMPRWTWLRIAARPPAPPAPDAADMGTAFGLDACFRDVPDTGPGALAPKAPLRLSRLTGLPRQR